MPQVDPVDLDDLGDWYSDYERRLDDEDEYEGWENDEEWERNLGAQTLDISGKSFGENEYWDTGDW